VAFQNYHSPGVAQARGQNNPSASKNGVPIHAFSRLRLALKNENTSRHLSDLNVRAWRDVIVSVTPGLPCDSLGRSSFFGADRMPAKGDAIDILRYSKMT
jgi:hypothetical protein